MQDDEKCQSCTNTECPSAGAGKRTTSEFEERRQLAQRLSKIRHKILILSGKGGVGKSTVAANLAVHLASAGNSVGLLDVDVHGPSIPRLLGLQGSPVRARENMLLPVQYSEKLRVMSIGFLLQHQDDAVIWRGPMKYGVIKQFLKDVVWGELDYLIIDSPPGTGDEPLSVAQLVQDADGAVIVTTPQALAISDVRKCVNFCKKLSLPVVGVIENMSGFVCPGCGRRVDIFKSGAGEQMAAEMGVPFLGRIPIEPGIVEASDEGRPFVAQGSQASKHFEQIARRIVELRGRPMSDHVTAEAQLVRIAVPVAGGKLTVHFGHAEQFMIFDVDRQGRRVVRSEVLPAPEHKPGLLPQWLKDQGVKVVLAGGMGTRAKDLLAENGVEVLIGVPSQVPSALVEAYIAGTLTTGENVCDH